MTTRNWEFETRMDLPDFAFAWITCSDKLLKLRIRLFVEFWASNIDCLVENVFTIRLVLAVSEND